jgi:hypothetical protein
LQSIENINVEGGNLPERRNQDLDQALNNKKAGFENDVIEQYSIDKRYLMIHP